MERFEGNIVNIFDNSIFYGEIMVKDDRIFQINRISETNPNSLYFLPGFVDAHVHIESAMIVPAQFGRMAVVHGTIGTVSDPHEIANVLGVEGIKYMIESGKTIPFKFCFGAPSCVPATNFETSGATIDSKEIESLIKDKDIGYLAEMMNFPGVINKDSEVLEKILIAKKYNKPIDGHAPGLIGETAEHYFSAGISTDHECFTYEEAEEKLKLGIKVLIREGSAAKNFEALIPLAKKYSQLMMFCSDDKHPDDLAIGHINLLVKRAVQNNIDVFDAIRMASLNPVRHYDLKIGLLREGEWADFIEVNNLEEFKVLKTFINGKKVAENGNSLIENLSPKLINNFNTNKISLADLSYPFKKETKSINVIKVNDGQLVTDKLILKLPINFEYNTIEKMLKDNEISKLVVFNRYQTALPAIAFVKGFKIKIGAIASSVAHDSHNIIAVGADDESILEAINLIIREKGGISAVSEKKMGILKLPIAGLMSDKDGYEVANDYTQIDKFSKEVIGCELKSPFMSLSFMALLVIPSLKLSDKGLFDGNKFEFINLEN